MALINIRGVNHYYEWISQSPSEIGSKPVMVFIHGWAGSGRYWKSTASALTSDFDCLVYDMRGFGRSRLPENPPNLSYELEEYAEDLAVLLRKLNINKIFLQAHSMGASVGALFLNRYPNYVRQAILTCNGIFEYDEKAFAAFHKFGGYVVKFRYNWFLKIPFADQLFMARFLSRPIAKSDRIEFLEDFLLADYESALGTIYTSVSKKAVEEMPKEFAKISVPTLMISGEKDRIIPAIMGKEATKLNDKLIYAEVPNTSHFPMLEDPSSYLQILKQFLQINTVVI
ncbi:MAG: alpha/beta hydrolase [Xenococcaceae cyanobacterium MO_167.B52]|nr:alpha/beta hydrolase [Xenococcaceae cyanobacterium MO_167.B52]